jgi:hypothetical protein
MLLLVERLQEDNALAFGHTGALLSSEPLFDFVARLRHRQG